MRRVSEKELPVAIKRNGHVLCPKCEHVNSYYAQEESPGIYECDDCCRLFILNQEVIDAPEGNFDSKLKSDIEALETRVKRLEKWAGLK